MRTGCCSTEPVRSANASELLRRGRVVAEPVLDEPEELAHRGRVGIGVAQRTQHAGRVALPPRGERLRGPRELVLGGLRVAARDPAQLVGRLGGTPAPARHRRASSPSAAVLRRLAGPLGLGGRRRLALDRPQHRTRGRRARAAPLPRRGAPSSGAGTGCRSGSGSLRPGSSARSASARAERRGGRSSLRRSRPPRASGRPRPSLRPELPRCAAGRRSAPDCRRCAAGRRCGPRCRRVPALGRPRPSAAGRGAPGCRSGDRVAAAARSGRPRPSVRGFPSVAPAAASGRTRGRPGRGRPPRSSRPRADAAGGRRPFAPRAASDGRSTSSCRRRHDGGAGARPRCVDPVEGGAAGYLGANAMMPAPRGAGIIQKEPGGDLLSQENDLQVPSARAGLTAVFGMGTGVSPPPWPPGICQFSARTRELHSEHETSFDS